VWVGFLPWVVGVCWVAGEKYCGEASGGGSAGFHGSLSSYAWDPRGGGRKHGVPPSPAGLTGAIPYGILDLEGDAGAEPPGTGVAVGGMAVL